MFTDASVRFPVKGSDMALYETTRALGLTSIVRPLLHWDSEYSFQRPDQDGEPDDDDYDYEGEEVYGVLLVGNEFHTFGEPCYDSGISMGTEECTEELHSSYPSERLYERKVTWLNKSRDTPKEPALANSAVRIHFRNLRGTMANNHTQCGNEVGISLYYSSAALLVRVPSFQERQASPKDEASLFDGIEADKVKKEDKEEPDEEGEEKSDEEVDDE